MIRVLIDENIPIPEGIQGSAMELIRRAGRDLSSADLRGIDALLVRSVTQVNQSLLSGSSVSFVGSATAGIDHIDVAYLQSAGISYHYAAGSNAASVVDYVLCSLAALNLNPQGHSVGIVGCGQVGGRLYRRLQALDCDCYCYDPFLSEAEQADLYDLEQVLKAQILCLHTPLTDSGPYPTNNMLSYEHLNTLPHGAVLINAGRGGVVNEVDLKRLVSERPDIRLVFDVWQDEPNIDIELVGLCQIATPHIAGYAAQSKLRGSQMVFDALMQHFEISVNAVSPEPSSVSKKIEEQQWNRALLEVYDPRADDAKLRANRDARGFDQLRKSYPQRYEIAEYQSENKILQSFGFSQPKG